MQIFRPTEFADLLHTASRLYFEGRYDQAATTWQEVLRHDAFFELAHTGLGKAAFKRGDYLGAMREYTVARNKDGYSQAFGEWRHDFLRANFAWVLPLIAFGAWVLTAVIRRTVRRLMALDLSSTDAAPQP